MAVRQEAEFNLTLNTEYTTWSWNQIRVVGTKGTWRINTIKVQLYNLCTLLVEV